MGWVDEKQTDFEYEIFFFWWGGIIGCWPIKDKW